MSKEILIISRTYFPTISPRTFRATELAEEFARQGHKVTVLIHNKYNYDYSNYTRNKKIKVKDFVGKKWYDIYSKNIILRIFRKALYLLFYLPDLQLSYLLKQYLLKQNHCYDLIVSVAVPYSIHWGVALAKNKKGSLAKVWIADCGDPFMGNKENRYTFPFYFNYIERWFCKQPDYITVPIKEAISAYPSICKDKIRVIPQGFKFDEITKNNTLKHKPVNNCLKFAYSGRLSPGYRDPKELLEYLNKKSNTCFEFTVYTNDKQLVLPYKAMLKEKLIIKDYVPRDKLLEELKDMDFLINIENLNNVQSPSKLIDYSLTGRPIMSIQPKSFDKSLIDKFLNRVYDRKLNIDNLDQYNIKNVAKKFLDLQK